MNPMHGPTPYDDVNETLVLLRANIEESIGEPLVGMYLCGSLALGDYDPETSDIDWIAVTRGSLDERQIEALAAMHTRLARGPLGRPHFMDGCYLPRADLRRFQPDAGPFPSWSDEGFRLFIPGGDWIIQRHIMLRYPVIVAGPLPRDLIDTVTPDDLRWGVSDVLQGWWAGQIERPEWIEQRTVLQVFTVQTMCRALYTLEQGDVCSKPAALRWAMTALPDPWRALAAEASRWKEGMSFAPLAETLALVRYAVERSRAFRLINPARPLQSDR